MISTSIRARLLASVAAIQIVGAGVATYLVVEHERHQSYNAFDANLGEEAAVVRSLVEAPEEGDDSIVFHREFMALPKGDRFFIADSTGRKIDGSDGWPDINPLPREPRSVVNVQVAGTQYRALVLQKLPVVDPDSQPTPASPTLTLIYAAPTAPVEEHIRRVELQSIAACLALLAVSTLVSAWALTRGLRPLRDLASGAEQIDVGRWTLPELEESKRFSELKPLANALSDLVDRLHAAFDRERQFFGDAAHEMKSSVAIVRSTLQFALQTDRSAADYRVELQDALEDTGRLQDLVASMLDLARIESITRVSSTRKPQRRKSTPRRNEWWIDFGPWLRKRISRSRSMPTGRRHGFECRKRICSRCFQISLRMRFFIATLESGSSSESAQTAAYVT
jgi:signal transduction histidine kinase